MTLKRLAFNAIQIVSTKTGSALGAMALFALLITPLHAQELKTISGTEGHKLLPSAGDAELNGQFISINGEDTWQLHRFDVREGDINQAAVGVGVAGPINGDDFFPSNSSLYVTGGGTAALASKSVNGTGPAKTRTLSFEETATKRPQRSQRLVYQIKLPSLEVSANILPSYYPSPAISVTKGNRYYIGDAQSKFISVYSHTEDDPVSEPVPNPELDMQTKLQGIDELILLESKNVLVAKNNRSLKVQFFDLETHSAIGDAQGSENGWIELAFLEETDRIISLETYLKPTNSGGSSLVLEAEMDIIESTLKEPLRFRRVFSVDISGMLGLSKRTYSKRSDIDFEKIAVRIAVSPSGERLALYSPVSSNIAIFELGAHSIERINIIPSRYPVERAQFIDAEGKSLVVQTPTGLSQYPDVTKWNSSTAILAGPTPIREAQRRLADVYSSDVTLHLIDGFFGPATNEQFLRFFADTGQGKPQLTLASDQLKAADKITGTSTDLAVYEELYVTNFGFKSLSRARYGVAGAGEESKLCALDLNGRLDLELAFLVSDYDWLPVICRNEDAASADKYPARVDIYYYRNGELIVPANMERDSFLSQCDIVRAIQEGDVILPEKKGKSQNSKGDLVEILEEQRSWRRLLLSCS